MHRARWFVLPASLVLIAAACGGDDGGGGGGGEVSIFGAFEAQEASGFQSVLDDKINNADGVDYTATYEGSAQFEEQIKIRVDGGNPPDIALYPQPGAVIEQAKAGKAIALEDLGLDIAQLEQTFSPYFLSLGEFEGKHYGIPSNINLKSLIWYAKDDFDAAGYQIPTTWDELIALSDQIVADGGTPWCIGLESGTATGWPATDWMEDIMLRTAGSDVYDQWVTHQIPFNDASVVRAGELFGDILFTDGYVLGGAEQIPAIAFGDAPLPMFEDPAGCFLHRQANFITSFFPEDAESGVDYDAFPFPDIDEGKSSALFAGELATVFRNAPEVKDFVERFISTDVQCANGSVEGNERISPNVEVGGDCYSDPLLAQAADVLTEALAANAARFDASDLMPSAVGAGSFWTGMVEYARGGADSLEGQLEAIESSWPAT